MHALIVDDDEDIRVVARMALELICGWDVSDLPSGILAVERAAGIAPDVILLDAMMPGLDGLSTLKALSEDPTTAHIPVIFMSAKAQSSERRELLDSCARGLIPKPFDPLQLGVEVEAILAATAR
jgi:two-component system alkaline phosphatase synthesis response regulator PhoP